MRKLHSKLARNKFLVLDKPYDSENIADDESVQWMCCSSIRAISNQEWSTFAVPSLFFLACVALKSPAPSYSNKWSKFASVHSERHLLLSWLQCHIVNISPNDPETYWPLSPHILSLALQNKQPCQEGGVERSWKMLDGKHQGSWETRASFFEYTVCCLFSRHSK